MNPEKLEKIVNDVLKFYKKIRAEVLVTELQNNSELEQVDFLIENKSTFSRAFDGDIIDADLGSKADKVTLNLSRNGLYDNLPEGLFHTQAISKNTKAYIQRRQTIKQEEQSSRTLFAPIENEFFHQRLEIERSERKLLKNFSHQKNDFLLDFWKIEEDIPEEYVFRLITLLPFRYKIVGNYELTAHSLTKIIDHKVTVNRTHQLLVNEEQEDTLGTRLGHDTILNSNFYGTNIPALEFVIGPLSTKKIETQLNEKQLHRFLEIFYDYFVPMEMEVITKLLVNNDCEFLLGESNKSILGVSSVV